MKEGDKCGPGMCGDGKCADGMCCGNMCGNMCGGKRDCGCMHHKVKPFLKVLLGAAVMAWGLGYLEPEMTAVFAGAVIILSGLHKMFAGMCKCC